MTTKTNTMTTTLNATPNPRHRVFRAFLFCIAIAGALAVSSAARADRGDLEDFPGVSAAYDRPTDADVVLDTSRLGVDVLGRISENQIAIILPETPLAGGLKFMQRMRKIVADSPIMLESGEQVKPGLKVSTDMLREEDASFMQLFDRTWKKTPVRKVKATPAAA